MAASNQKAELNQACLSVLICSGFGQKQSFKQTNIGREFASFFKVISNIEDPAVIPKILAHLDDNEISAAKALLPDCRASPSPLMDLLV
jgi:hypothetical protein